jgi:probable DNA metabolism protein
MTTLQYDGSFCGLLTAVFEVYERKLDEVRLSTAGTGIPDVFGDTLMVHSDETKACRVWTGLCKKLSPAGTERFFSTHLSELPGVEDNLLYFARYVFDSAENVEEDFGHPAVLRVTQTARKVWREKHRMEAFVRFQELKDNLFYSLVEPDHNVLPLIAPHFRNRYADQDWLIYDGRRKYGIHHEKNSGTVQEVFFSAEYAPTSNTLDISMLNEREELFQTLWRDYFKSTGIPARVNPRLHMRHIPLRYWKHLTEKKVSV